MTDADPWPGGMICAVCRVVTVRSGTGWTHPSELVEKFAHTGVCAEPVPGREPKLRELRFGRGGDGHRDRHMLFGNTAAVPGPVTVGADGSYLLMTSPKVRKLVSWGFVGTNGSYGLGSSAPAGTTVGDKRTLYAELRGLFWGLRSTHPEHPVTMIVDSLDAVELIDEWRTGSTGMPTGYNLGERVDGSPPLLVQLAESVRQRGALLTVQWVPGHSGVPLNEGADALSKIARAWGQGRLTKATVRTDALSAANLALRRYVSDLVV